MAERISIPRLFLIWLKIGCISFGGGAVTQYLIQEHFAYRRRLISPDDYTNIVAMSQIAPGINIAAIAILIGKRLGGGLGVAVSLLGLIVPSAAITVALTAIYASFSSFPRVQSALRSSFAAVFGISIVANWRNVRPILSRNLKRGPGMLAASLLLASAALAAYSLLSPSVAALYVGGAVLGALLYRLAAGSDRGAKA